MKNIVINSLELGEMKIAVSVQSNRLGFLLVEKFIGTNIHLVPSLLENSAPAH